MKHDWRVGTNDCQMVQHLDVHCIACGAVVVVPPPLLDDTLPECCSLLPSSISADLYSETVFLCLTSMPAKQHRALVALLHGWHSHECSQEYVFEAEVQPEEAFEQKLESMVLRLGVHNEKRVSQVSEGVAEDRMRCLSWVGMSQQKVLMLVVHLELMAPEAEPGWLHRAKMHMELG